MNSEEKKKEVWELKQVMKEDKNPQCRSCMSYIAQEIEVLLHTLDTYEMGKIFVTDLLTGLTISQPSCITYSGTLPSTVGFWFVALSVYFIGFSSKPHYYLACVKYDLSFVCKVYSSVSIS